MSFLYMMTLIDLWENIVWNTEEVLGESCTYNDCLYGEQEIVMLIIPV